MIECVTGLPGMGKTVTTTRWALKKMKQGKKVYSNYHIDGAEYVRDPRELLGQVTNALIVVDEMGIIFDQITMYQIDPNVWIELRQHRKDGCDIIGTAQSLYDIAYPMRRLIQFEWNIHMKMWRYAFVSCRNPQPRGATYGKRVWYLSNKVFNAYDTNQKVLTEPDGSDEVDTEKVIYMAKEHDIQKQLMIDAYYKSFANMQDKIKVG